MLYQLLSFGKEKFVRCLERMRILHLLVEADYNDGNSGITIHNAHLICPLGVLISGG